jgi:hypothetical protein
MTPASMPLEDKAYAASINFGALSLNEIRSLHDGAALISDVSTAISCQPRSHQGQADGGRYNTLGDFAEWNASVCGWIKERCVKEAMSRLPADTREAATRLDIIKEFCIGNEDFHILAQAVDDISVRAKPCA